MKVLHFWTALSHTWPRLTFQPAFTDRQRRQGHWHGVHIHHDTGFADGGTTLRFRFAGLNKDESFTIGHVDRELKDVHAGHLCYANLYPTSIRLRDNKTGVSDLAIRARRQPYLDRKEPLPNDLDALLKTKEKSVAWKADLCASVKTLAQLLCGKHGLDS